MAQRTVVWTDMVKQQRRGIFKYWNKRNGSTRYSTKLIKAIGVRIQQLVQHPLSGKETELTGSLQYHLPTHGKTPHHFRFLGYTSRP